MDTKLQNKLFKKFDFMFRDRKLTGDKTRMCDGIVVGNGWYSLIEILCKGIQREIDKHNLKNFSVFQVKSKFAKLRMYVNGGNDKIERLIDEAEHLSERTCEYCGEDGKCYDIDGWLEILCKTCVKKELERVK